MFQIQLKWFKILLSSGKIFKSLSLSSDRIMGEIWIFHLVLAPRYFTLANYENRIKFTWRNQGFRFPVYENSISKNYVDFFYLFYSASVSQKVVCISSLSVMKNLIKVFWRKLKWMRIIELAGGYPPSMILFWSIFLIAYDM